MGDGESLGNIFQNGEPIFSLYFITCKSVFLVQKRNNLMTDKDTKDIVTKIQKWSDFKRLKSGR